MADQLEEIKNKIDIVTFISEYLPLKKAGRNFKALCPFHGEKTPSFIISPERQIWHCFGCQKGGDVFGFLMQIENLEFPEALEILAKRAGVKLVTSYQASEQAKLKDKLFKINHLASEFYHYLLLNHRSGKQALDYILGRGIKKQSMETFFLGWAPNMWDGLMRFLIKKGFTARDLETAGLIIKAASEKGLADRYYDRFRGRLMFALRDQRGNVIGFAGRTLDPEIKEAKYINTPETPVYIKGNTLYGLDITKEAIKKDDEAIIVEGELDLISSFQAGVANVVAIKGSALTENQLNLLKRFTQNINLALDMDLAGDAAAKRGMEIADEMGFSIKMVQLPQGKDPDECARINPSLWQQAVKKAIPVFDFIMDSATLRYDKQNAEGKKKIGDEVIPYLAKISNPIIQAHYFSKLANLLNVSEEVIVETAKKMAKTEEIKSSTPQQPVTSVNQPSRQQLLEEQLLAMILQNKEPQTLIAGNRPNETGETKPVSELPITDEFFQGVNKKIFTKLQEFTSLGKKFTMAEFIKTLPQELVPAVDRLYLFDLGKTLDDSKLFDKELTKTAREIKKIFLKNKVVDLSQELKKSNTSGQMDGLMQQYRELTAELKKFQASE